MMADFLRIPLIIGTLPNTIANGQTADAVPLMADLNYIVNQVNANAQAIGLAALLASANSFTQVQSGVAATGAANFPIASQVQNQAFNTLSSTLGTNVLTARVAALPLAAYAVGQVFTFIPAQQNTNSATMNIDSLGSAVLKSAGQVLVGGELGSSAALVRVSTAGAQPVLDLLNPQRSVPPGIIWDYAGAIAPSGWLICDGSAVSRSVFVALFNAIGTTWGSSVDTASFNIPNLQGRVTVGYRGSAMSMLGSNIGSLGGEDTHVLTIAELAAHTHTMNITTTNLGTGGGSGVDFKTASGADVTGSTGSGTAHNNMQPSAVVLKIIKT